MQSFFDRLSRCLTTDPAFGTFNPYGKGRLFFLYPKRPAFDCLVVDIQLEGMSGIELNEQLASTGFTTPVIFVTAHEKAGELKQSLRNRCAAFLLKSDPGEELLTVIDQSIQVKNSQLKT